MYKISQVQILDESVELECEDLYFSTSAQHLYRERSLSFQVKMTPGNKNRNDLVQGLWEAAKIHCTHSLIKGLLHMRSSLVATYPTTLRIRI